MLHKKLLELLALMGFLLFSLYLYCNTKLWIPSLSKDQPSTFDLVECTTSSSYYNYTVTVEEYNFPIAYSILVYSQPDRFFRLLSAIYRPHNMYCVHIDRKTPIAVTKLLYAYAQCFKSNVFFVPDTQRTAVRWGYFSVLEPDLTCARLLLKRNATWKYWINLTGQEFPLRTNRELVLALKALNGTNVVGATLRQRNMMRFPSLRSSNLNITWYKGPVHVAVRREFVDFMLHDHRAIQLLDLLKHYDTTSWIHTHPDETFFSTLNHNPHVFPVPGAFLGQPEDNFTESLIRYKIWDVSGRDCGTDRWVRNICMLGVNDLPSLTHSPHLFANKFMPNIEPIGYKVLETWMADKVSFESTYGTCHPSFDLNFYAKQEIAWNHL